MQKQEPQQESTVVHVPKWIATLVVGSILTGAGTLVVSTIVGGEKLDRLVDDVREIRTEQKSAIEKIFEHETKISVLQAWTIERDKTSTTQQERKQ